LKPEWWGSPLVQEKKYREKPVRREDEIIIIMKRKVFTDFSTPAGRKVEKKEAQKTYKHL
jgi:hypothetical protein